MTQLKQVPECKGVYILLLKIHKQEKITIGKTRVYLFDAGYYLYAGSAVGSGGIKGRLKHHVKISSKPHWHIDYLRQHAALNSVYYTPAPKEMEHSLAHKLSGAFKSPIVKFGSSDCNCNSHLFYSKTKPSLMRLNKLLETELKIFPYELL